ncbi:hypothetical protein AAG570_012560 [Ranatra chinensis]|uniref:Uncharacterized protein n=1 Tax=Ranatra chinensis TaxID=642074 RepID=A0ABD0YE75_9HEMI
MDIFSRTMALVEADNIIVVSDDETETDRVTQSLDIKPSAPHKGFSQLAVNLAINKIEKHIKKEQTELEFMSPHNIKKEISVNFPSEFNKEGLETPTNFAQATVASASSNDLIIRNFQSQTDEKIDSLDSIPPNLPMDDHLKNSIIVDALEMKNIIFDNQKQNVTALKVRLT